MSNFSAETWFGDGHRFTLTISWAMWGAWSRDSALEVYEIGCPERTKPHRERFAKRNREKEEHIESIYIYIYKYVYIYIYTCMYDFDPGFGDKSNGM